MKDTQNYYAEDGVPINAEDEFSRRCGALCRTTYGNSRFVKITDICDSGHRSPRGFQFVNIPEGCYVDFTADGCGAKPVIIDAVHTHKTAGTDLLAMLLADIDRWGGLALIVVDHLDLNTLVEVDSMPFNTYLDMMRGLCESATEQGVVVYSGETAQMTDCVGSDIPNSPTKFNWSGACIGLYDPKRIITGTSIEPGMVVMALREKGFRGNGWSAVRKAFRLQFGDEWWRNSDAKPWLQEAATPSTLYDRFLTTANGWHSPDFQQQIIMHCIAHISGGGIDLKFGKSILFKMGLSADLNNLWEPPEVMRQVVQWRGMHDREAYKVFNGGQGALAVIDAADVKKFIRLAEQFNIEAKACGTITKESSPRVTINSKFNGEKVIFTP